jgi:hypothetical protein
LNEKKDGEKVLRSEIQATITAKKSLLQGHHRHQKISKEKNGREIREQGKEKEEEGWTALILSGKLVSLV